MAQIEMDAVEAMLTLEAVQREALNELIASAKHGPAGEAAEIRSKVLQRVASRIADTFLPEPISLDEMRRQHRLDEAELGIA
jgi:hypothetical protein